MNNKSLILFAIFSISLLSCHSSNDNKESDSFSHESESENISLSSSIEESEESEESLLSNISEIKNDLLDKNVRPLVKWEGRYEYKANIDNHPNMVYLYHTATGFTVDFYGTKLEVGFAHFREDNGVSNIYYDMAIDDETLPNPVGRRFCLEKAYATKVITLCEGLELGHHRVKCLKMDEAIDSITGIYSFKTDGTFYYRDTVKDNENTKFMFICASGGSGFGSLAYTEDSSKSISRTTANSSSLHAFNYLTARRYNADVQFVATSGWGVRYPENKQVSLILDKVGLTSNSVDSALQTGDWNYQRYVPDYIIFNIGGNDTPNSSFNLDNYKERVVEMVNKLHTYYPLARMIWTHTNSNAGGYAINALKAAGIMDKGYLYECIFSKVGAGETGNGTYGASNHASLKTHIDNAKIIVNTIAEHWRFLPSVEPITFEQFDSIISYHMD